MAPFVPPANYQQRQDFKGPGDKGLSKEEKIKKTIEIFTRKVLFPLSVLAITYFIVLPIVSISSPIVVGFVKTIEKTVGNIFVVGSGYFIIAFLYSLLFELKVLFRLRVFLTMNLLLSLLLLMKFESTKTSGLSNFVHMLLGNDEQLYPMMLGGLIIVDIVTGLFFIAKYQEQIGNLIRKAIGIQKEEEKIEERVERPKILTKNEKVKNSINQILEFKQLRHDNGGVVTGAEAVEVISIIGGNAVRIQPGKSQTIQDVITDDLLEFIASKSSMVCSYLRILVGTTPKHYIVMNQEFNPGNNESFGKLIELLKNDKRASFYKSLEDPNISKKFYKSKDLIYFGVDILGQPIIGDISAFVHFLIGGATRAGKSVLMHTIIQSQMLKKTPEELQLAVFDPKQGVEFLNDMKRETSFDCTEYSPYISQFAPVDNEDVGPAVVYALHKEALRRMELLKQSGIKKLGEVPESKLKAFRIKNNFPTIIVVVDEYKVLRSWTTGKIIDEIFTTLIGLVAFVDMHFIIATQKVSSETINSTMKANMNSAFALRVKTYHDSQAIIERSGAEKLRGLGDCMLAFAGNVTRFQAGFIPNTRELLLEKFDEHDKKAKTDLDYKKRLDSNWTIEKLRTFVKENLDYYNNFKNGGNNRFKDLEIEKDEVNDKGKVTANDLIEDLRTLPVTKETLQQIEEGFTEAGTELPLFKLESMKKILEFIRQTGFFSQEEFSLREAGVSQKEQTRIKQYLLATGNFGLEIDDYGSEKEYLKMTKNPLNKKAKLNALGVSIKDVVVRITKLVLKKRAQKKEINDIKNA